MAHSDEMSDSALSALNDKINVKAYFERILHDQKQLDDEREKRMDERFAGLAKALELQAKEYERRLGALNDEYGRDRARTAAFVTVDKFETAIERINEKFDDYVKRYEQDKRDLDVLLAAQRGAADEAKRAAEATGRRANLNLSVVAVCLAALTILVNVTILLLAG